MGTIILNELLENSDIDFNSLKVGNQFINIHQNTMYDMHESCILNDIKYDFLYSFKSIKLIYNVNREATSEIVYKDYIRIFDTTVKVHEGEISCTYRNTKLGEFLNKTNFETVKTNDITTLKLSNEEYVYFCRIPLKNNYLVLAYHIDFSKEFMEKKLYSAIFNSSTDKCVAFDIDNPDQFIDKLIELSSGEAILKFKSEVYDVCKYSIKDYLDNKDKTLLGRLFGTAIDKCFRPIFKHDNFAIYLDYLNINNPIVNTHNGKVITFMGPEYKRISTAINKYYTTGDIINPLTGKIVDGSVVYTDASGAIFEDNYEIANYSRTIIYGVYVECMGTEKQDLIDRMNIVNKLTT